MKLEEYLKAIKECPDETVEYFFMGRQCTSHRLSADFGVYDNFPIFLNADFDGVVRYLKESGKYHCVNESSDDVPAMLFHYAPGTVVIPIYNRKTDMAHTRYGNVITGMYAADMTLHPYQEKKIGNTHWLRAIAEVIDDLGRFIIRENIPACLLHALGWRYLEQPDSIAQQRIVCHNPEGLIVSEYLRIKT